jgi:hypothetical protein
VSFSRLRCRDNGQKQTKNNCGCRADGAHLCRVWRISDFGLHFAGINFYELHIAPFNVLFSKRTFRKRALFLYFANFGKLHNFSTEKDRKMKENTNRFSL